MKRVLQVLAIVAILIAGVSAIGVAYAFSGYTENTNNTSEAEYVVLSQENYSFGTGVMAFSTVTVRGPDGNPMTTYVLAGDTSSFTIGGDSFTGVQIGDPDRLFGRYAGPGTPSEISDVYVQTVGTGFTDLSELGWYYVVKVSCDGESDQYVYWDGNALSWTGTFDLAIDHDNITKTYTTELYIAVPDEGFGGGGEIPPTIVDDGTLRFVYSSV